MKRWHEDKLRLEREHKLYRKHVPESPWFDTAWVDDLGRYRKKKGLDCGNTQCWICHSDKFPKRSKHLAEVVSDISFKEQLGE